MHDIPALIQRHGGAPRFVSHLDLFFSKHLAMWKEIVLHTPYLYHFAGCPERSSARARTLLYDKYLATPTGLPDNEDMGSHSTYAICVSMGLYPIYGQNLYLMSAPVFEQTDISVAHDRTFTIRAQGIGPDAHYITGASLNGVKLERPWLRHRELTAGGELVLEVSDRANGWGSGQPPQHQ